MADVRELLNQLSELGSPEAQELADILAPLLSNTATLRSADQRIQQRWLSGGKPITSDYAGVARDLLGDSYFDIINDVSGTNARMNQFTPRQLDINFGSGADCMFDYLVSPCFSSLAGFVEGTVYTSLPGCTFKGYSMLTGAGHALLDALSTGASKRIFMCGSETATQTTDISSTPAGNALILITGSGSNTRGSQITLTGPTGLDLFTGDPNKAGGATTLEIQFNGVAIAVDTGKAIFSPSADSGNTRFYLQFRNCFFNMPAAAIWRVVLGQFHGAGLVDIDNCQGTIQYPCWLQFNSFHSKTESLVIRNCQQPRTGSNGPNLPHTALAIANFWKNDGAANSVMINCSLLNSSIELTAQMTLDQGAAATPVTNLTVQNVYLYYTGATGTTAFTGKIPSNAQWYFENIVFDVQSLAAVNFGSFTDSTAGNQTPVVFKNIYGSSSVAQAGTFLTLPGTITGKGVDVSGVGAPQWATVYSGPAGTSASGGPSLADPFVTIGNPADLTASRAITPRYNIYGTDGGANSPYTLDSWVKGANIASAATLTLGTDGDIFHVTGAIGITAIAAPTRQTLVVLIFDSNPLLTNSANLILEGGVNYQTQAGDIVIFAYEGAGVWREVNRNTPAAWVTDALQVQAPLGLLKVGVDSVTRGRIGVYGPATGGGTAGGELHLHPGIDNSAGLGAWILACVTKDLWIYPRDASPAYANIFTVGGALSLGQTGSGGGVLIGNDAHLWRGAASELWTDSALKLVSGKSIYGYSDLGVTQQWTIDSSSGLAVFKGSSLINNGNLLLYNTANTFYAALRANAAQANNIVYVLPLTDPTAGQVLSASAPAAGISTLSWVPPNNWGPLMALNAGIMA